ncbi:uncharacterized protein LOC116300914 [Actinia tenebrosa]|uniref:Uncharacterized protein LOC116300914 n=1 Tax=Actinia tenebrosa TaxID=6105 RepID=A0A6P8IG87_ACTTE|nr:uncharacterized protein LOC116300914 [Actinia tenebrosa]
MKQVGRMQREELSECGSGFATGLFSPVNPVKENVNLLHLKTISQSFDDLTSETLYSKWKKARKNGAKIGRHSRSISLISLPEEDLAIGKDDGKEFTNRLALDLRRQIFRQRGWTVSSGENLKEKVDSFPDTASMCSTEPDGLTITTFSSSDNLDDDVFASSSTKPDKADSIQVKKLKIISEIISGTSGDFVRRIRSLSDSDQRISDRPIRARIRSDPDSNTRVEVGNRRRSLSCREAREIEFLRTAEMAQRYLDAQQEDVWKKRSLSSSGNGTPSERHKRIPRGPVIHTRSEGNYNLVNIQETASFGFTDDRSQADSEERYVLSTYGLIHQPRKPQSSYLRSLTNNTFSVSQEIKKSSQNPGFLLRTMSEPNQRSTKELSSSEEKEKDEKKVLFKEVDVIGSLPKGTYTRPHGVRRAQTLPRMPKRPLNSFSMKNWKENELRTRKTANDLLDHINNSSDKTQQERVDVVEKAFEWIRKEVADLRAQDKDIMRMFTKIQAGIRHIKFDQSNLMESDEDFISTPDLSRERASSFQSKDDLSVTRRASLL